MYIPIPKRGADRNQKGPWWWPLKDGDKSSASMCCPDCNKVSVLTEHNIGATGVVGPSVVCARHCGFHAFVKLEGWP